MDQLTISVDDLEGPASINYDTETMGLRERHSPSLENLFSNRDVLARRLAHRLDRDDLVSRNIIPAHYAAPGIHEKATQLERKKTGDIIQRKIRVRPSKKQLIERHILTDTSADPSLQERVEKLERQRIADQLNERLAVRPGPIELIHDHILPVEDDIATAIEHGEVRYHSTCEDALSPGSISESSPAGLSDIESSIAGLNCTSPSPPPPPPTIDVFGDAFKAYNEKNKAYIPSVSTSAYAELNKQISQTNASPISPSFDPKKIIASLASCPQVPKPLTSHISLSQKENERLVRSFNKKQKASKPKVKKLKFHEYGPPESKPQTLDAPLDDRYKRLLEQQTLYLRLQVMQQNAMLNALQGNTDSMDAVTEAIESVVESNRDRTAAGIHSSNSGESTEGKPLDDYRVIELRAQCKQRGLIVSGPKAKLIERLRAYECGQSSPSDFNHNHMLQNSFDRTGMVPLNTTVQSMPPSSILQVTTGGSKGGVSTYNVVQSDVKLPQQMQFVNSSQNSPGQLQLGEVELQPVVNVAQPQVVTVHENATNNPSPVSHIQSPPMSAPAPLQLERSPSIQFQFSPPPHQPAPTIVLQPAAQLEHAPVKQKVQPVHYSPQGVFNHSGMTFSGTPSTDSPMSQSVPANLFYGHGVIQNSHLNNELLLQQGFLRQNSLGSQSNCSDDDPFRGRASSEPASNLQQRKRSPWLKKDMMSAQVSMARNNYRGLSPTVDEMKTEALPTSRMPELGSDMGQRMSSPNSARMRSPDQNYQDIMDIIGELSTPSPNSTGGTSPFSPTFSNPNLSDVDVKAESDLSKADSPGLFPQSCVYDSRQKSPVNKFLAVNQQKMKAFNSVPNDINYLGLAPGQQQGMMGSCHSLSGSSGNLSGSSGNLVASAGQLGSTGNLAGASVLYNTLNQNSLGLHSSFNNLSHSSSTGNIPQQIRADGNYQNMSAGYPNNSASGYMNPVSPMNIDEQALNMELDVLANPADLSWMNLSANSNNPSPLPPQAMFSLPDRTNQASLFGTSPGRHDDYGAVFDMEATATEF